MEIEEGKQKRLSLGAGVQFHRPLATPHSMGVVTTSENRWGGGGGGDEALC